MLSVRAIVTLSLFAASLTYPMNPAYITPSNVTQSTVQELIKILNHPEEYEQPDHVLICGKSGSGKSAIFNQIIENINASYISCEASDLIDYDKAVPNKLIMDGNLKKIIVDKAIREATRANTKIAVLLINHFHLLYEKRKSLPYLMRSLDPNNHQEQAIKNNIRFLIVGKSHPLDSSVNGENIILTSPARKSALEQKASDCVIS